MQHALCKSWQKTQTWIHYCLQAKYEESGVGFLGQGMPFLRLSLRMKPCFVIVPEILVHQIATSILITANNL